MHFISIRTPDQITSRLTGSARAGLAAAGWMVHLFWLITLFSSDRMIGWLHCEGRPPSSVAIGDVNLPELP